MSFLPLSSPPSRQSDHPPTLIPSPIPDPAGDDAPPKPNALEDEATDSTPLLRPPNFAPFFTLLNTTSSSVTHHPTVHYIFSDDTSDSDPITSATFQVLDDPSPSSSPPRNTNDGHDHDINTKERFVLVDMDATGTKVLSAQSMSPDWAVTSTELSPAPTWDRDGEGKQEEEEERGLMLRIEGMEVPRDKGAEQMDEKGLEDLVQEYERGMEQLRRVVDARVRSGLGHIPQS